MKRCAPECLSDSATRASRPRCAGVGCRTGARRLTRHRAFDCVHLFAQTTRGCDMNCQPPPAHSSARALRLRLACPSRGLRLDGPRARGHLISGRPATAPRRVPHGLFQPVPGCPRGSMSLLISDIVTRCINRRPSTTWRRGAVHPRRSRLGWPGFGRGTSNKSASCRRRPARNDQKM
jgi:hypothetical protein